MRDAARLPSKGCIQQSYTDPEKRTQAPELDRWWAYLLPSELRNVRVAGGCYLGGLVTREEMQATITAAKLVAACRRRAEVLP